MPSSRARSTSSSRSTAVPATTDDPGTEAESPTFGNFFEHWAQNTMKAQIATGNAGTESLLRGVRDMCEAQLQATNELESIHQRLLAQAESAPSAADLSTLQMQLLQSVATESMRCLTEVAAAAMRSVASASNDFAAACIRQQQQSLELLPMFWQAVASAKPEILEAEVEHFMNPLTSSPFGWPIQQAMAVAGQAWAERAMPGSTGASHLH